MNKDSKEYKELYERYGDMADFMYAQEEKEEKQKDLNYKLNTYDTGVIIDEMNLVYQDMHRRRVDGEDYQIKDAITKFESDPKYIEAKKAQQKNIQKEIDDEKFWDDFHKKAKREHELNESLRKKFGDKAVDTCLDEQEYKRFKKKFEE